MNVFGKRERGWRKKRKRGVSPIIATILLVAITVVLAAVLYVLITGLTTGGANSTPIGGSFSTSAAQASATGNTVLCATTGTGLCYSAQVQTAGSAATTANVHFAVTVSGTPVAGFTVVLTDSSGVVLATYTQGTGWAGTGLPVTMVVGDYLYLYNAGGNPTSLQTGTFQAIGLNGLNGAYSISTSLP